MYVSFKFVLLKHLQFGINICIMYVTDILLHEAVTYQSTSATRAYCAIQFCHNCTVLLEYNNEPTTH